MKKLFSTKYSAGAFNAAMLFLRLGAGALMIMHGYDKLVHFSAYRAQFINFMGIGTTLSLALFIFAEFFCSLFIMLGLFTRLATIPLITTILVALFKIHDAHFFGNGETDSLFLLCFFVILFVGPGKVSVDSMIGK